MAKHSLRNERKSFMTFVFTLVMEGGQAFVESGAGYRRVHILGGQSVHKELEASDVPDLLRPQVDAAPNDETEVGKLSPFLVHFLVHLV